MSRDKRVPLRMEDATSWEEFQARYDAQMEVVIRRYTSPLRWLWFAAATWSLIIDALLWDLFAGRPSPGRRWIILSLAVFFLLSVIICFIRSPVPYRPIGKRQRKLDAVRDDWKARADRGEIPMTTPGGPKVWQEQ
jgi:hypothetical protein